MCPQQADSLSTVKDESSEHSQSQLCSLCAPSSSSGYESSLSMCELTVPLELMEVKTHITAEARLLCRSINLFLRDFTRTQTPGAAAQRK